MRSRVVDEVDFDVPERFQVDGCHELWQLIIQTGFYISPVVCGTPVVEGIHHQLQSHTIFFSPFLICEIRRQACQFKLSLEEFKLVIWDVDLKFSAWDE